MNVVKMPAPARSMTGYARVEKATPYGDVAVALKTVNHRGLDVHFHLPPELDAFENGMRAAIKRAVVRGHVDVRVIYTPVNGAGGGGLNQLLFRAWLDAFRAAANEVNSKAEPDLNQAFRIPGMFGSAPERPATAELEPDLMTALDEALVALNAFREREGEELAGVIRAHNRTVAGYCDEMQEIRGRAMPAFQARLQERVRELLRGVSVDPQRLAQEAALLADRSDIGEEIARLRIHSRQVDQLLDTGGEAGKKLDFLLQEMNRESNTIVSKTNGIGETGLRITDLALAAKADIEKMREQSLNLE